jgi:hypothetical protein
MVKSYELALDAIALYTAWPRLVELCAVAPSNGLMEKRGGALIDIDKNALEKRMRMYYDPEVEWETLSVVGTGLTRNAAAFDARKTREKVIKAEKFDQGRLVRYALRPFDTRWCYYTGISPLWNRSRPDLWRQCWDGNAFLMSRVATAKDIEGSAFYFTTLLSDDHFLSPDASCFPIRLRLTTLPGVSINTQQAALFTEGEPSGDGLTANLSPAGRAYLLDVGINDPDADDETAALIWMHALAIGYSPAYLAENADGIRQDWPRVPLPATREALKASAMLGTQVAALLDTEHQVISVTTGSIRPDLRIIGPISREDGGQLSTGDLAVTAGWGHRGQNGVVMPGKGRMVEREYTPKEMATIKAGVEQLGLSLEDALAQLGQRTCDVYLNDVTYWRNVPVGVWEYVIGGYQVIKKWLSYREQPLLGRPLTSAEVREVQAMARRIAAILLLQPALDSNYLAIKAASYPWPAATRSPATDSMQSSGLSQ